MQRKFRKTVSRIDATIIFKPRVIPKPKVNRVANETRVIFVLLEGASETKVGQFFPHILSYSVVSLLLLTVTPPHGMNQSRYCIG